MIPFASVQASGKSKSLNASRLINLFPEIPAQGSRSPLILRSTPGLGDFSIVGTGPVRDMHVMDSVPFLVSGGSLYSVDENGTATLRGAIAGTGHVGMESNAAGELVVINSDGTGWLWDGATLATIASYDADFLDDAASVTFLDQYFIFARKNTGQVFVSGVNNGKTYNALAFGTAEYAPDNVVEVKAHAGQLWIFGENTIEIWYNSGAQPMPFVRIGGGVLPDTGGTANTAATLDQTIYWLGSDSIVYGATGLQPRRISTHEIEDRIKDWTNPKAFTYKNAGHAFYVLTSDQGAVVYDAASGLWHERNSFNVSRWRGCCYAKAYGKMLVGDYLLGIIYEMSASNHTDGANDLQRRVISNPYEDNGSPVSMQGIQVHFEQGVGLTLPPSTELYSADLLDEDGLPLLDESGTSLLAGLSRLVPSQGVDPHVILDWSDDGGLTWSNEHWGSIGKIGEYRKRSIWRRLGRFRYRVFRVTYTDPTPFTIYGMDA